MNKVILIGRLAKDPELRTTASGTSVSKFTLAVNRGKDQNGNDRGADFINCAAWRKRAENLAKYCQKGSKIVLEGFICNYSYEEQNGDRRYVTEVVADKITFLGGRQQESQFSSNQEALNSAINETDPFKEFDKEFIEMHNDEFNWDLPF